MEDQLEKIEENTDINWEDYPEDILKNVAIVDSIVNISEDIKGNKDLIDLIKKLKAKGYRKTHFSPSDRFHKTFSRSTLSLSLSNSEGNSLQEYIKRLLAEANAMKATDIHIKDLGTNCVIYFRILGLVYEYKTEPSEFGKSIITCIFNIVSNSPDETSLIVTEHQDARIIDKNYLPENVSAIRVHTAPSDCPDNEDGFASCMFLRFLYDLKDIKGSLEERFTKFGFLPEQIEAFRGFMNTSGLTIVSGATGSGKTTTLCHLLQCMVKDYSKKSYMSIEDPPEYKLQGVTQVPVSTKGKDRGANFNTAIASAMRSDPDVLLVGETRYAETVIACMNASLSGHQLLTTFHASDALAIISRMVNMLSSLGEKNPLESLCEPSLLSGLTYQRLVPVLCPKCSHNFVEYRQKHGEGSYDSKMEKILLSFSKGRNLSNVRIVNNDGCEDCKKGLAGMQVVAEVIVVDAILLRHLRKGDYEGAKKYFIEQGGITYLEHARRIIFEGKADPLILQARLGVSLDMDREDLQIYDQRREGSSLSTGDSSSDDFI